MPHPNLATDVASQPPTSQGQSVNSLPIMEQRRVLGADSEGTIVSAKQLQAEPVTDQLREQFLRTFGGQIIFQNIIHPQQSQVVDLMRDRGTVSHARIKEVASPAAELRAMINHLFGSPEGARAAYAIYANRQAAHHLFTAQQPTHRLIQEKHQLTRPIHSTNRGCAQLAKLIGDTSGSQQWVSLDDKDNPFPLAMAIKDQALHLAQRERWWEMLEDESLALSEHGQHGVLLRFPQQRAGFPKLISSALIQEVPAEYDPNKNTLLTRNPYFRGNKWHMLTNGQQMKEAIDRYVSEQTVAGRFFDAGQYEALPGQTYHETGQLEEDLIATLGPQNMFELIRLTGNEAPTTFQNSYHGLANFSALQMNAGRPYSFGVSYQTLSNIFEVLERESGLICYQPTSEAQLKPDEPITRKMVLFNGNLATAMQAIDWRKAGAQLMRMNKHMATKSA